jgi:hypothetical protein
VARGVEVPGGLPERERQAFGAGYIRPRLPRGPDEIHRRGDGCALRRGSLPVWQQFSDPRLWTDYQTLYRTFRHAIADFTDREQAAILHDTAARLYRIG